MKKIVKYVLNEDECIAIKKITGNILHSDMKLKYGLTSKEVELVSNFYDLITELK